MTAVPRVLAVVAAATLCLGVAWAAGGRLDLAGLHAVTAAGLGWIALDMDRVSRRGRLLERAVESGELRELTRWRVELARLEPYDRVGEGHVEASARWATSGVGARDDWSRRVRPLAAVEDDDWTEDDVVAPVVRFPETA